MNIIKVMRKAIPSVSCKEGCHECCGIVPFSTWELGRIEPLSYKTITCSYLNESGCSIYRERPILCRLMGASMEPKLACPYGCIADNPLSIEDTRAIMEAYMPQIPDHIKFEMLRPLMEDA